MEATIKFIGVVHSALKRIADCPLQESEQAPEADLEIFPEFIEGIKDVGEGSEILLLTWLHEADRSIIKCVRRNNFNSPLIGVFSTRSPDRPNPMGVHKAKVISVTQNKIKVSALEVLDQTPLVDIKPA
jgi:tRNA-Thr(GGU) m(6)t(6)A37 methyltransferase TsaA